MALMRLSVWYVQRPLEITEFFWTVLLKTSETKFFTTSDFY